ncbi:uncharacterized protein LOC123502518 [Portunus trituberculatus]|uniref:uncharacterized protein LOC123502518 n=1 Tax=Portunus trituberculatus TaxID=210409 RepID=UPI001E1CEB7B|nr:uncharacterized protein LOC123502518 [Portunus trituberculatus]
MASSYPDGGPVLYQFNSRHHARYISPLQSPRHYATTDPSSLRSPVSVCVLSSGVTCSKGGNSNGKFYLRDGGFSCGEVTCRCCEISGPPHPTLQPQHSGESPRHYATTDPSSLRSPVSVCVLSSGVTCSKGGNSNGKFYLRDGGFSCGEVTCRCCEISGPPHPTLQPQHSGESPRHYATTDPSSLRSPVSVCVLSSGVTCSKGGNSNGKFYLRDGGFSCGEVTCRCCEISGPPHPTLQPQHSGESPRHYATTDPSSLRSPVSVCVLSSGVTCSKGGNSNGKFYLRDGGFSCGEVTCRCCEISGPPHPTLQPQHSGESPRHYATTDPSSLRSPVSVCVLSSGVTCSKGGNSNGKFYLRDGGFSCGEVTCRCCEISGPPHPTLQPQHSGESPRHYATTDPSSLRSPVSVCVLSSGVTCSKGGNSNGKFYLRDGGFSCGEVTCRCCEISGPPHPTLQPQHSGESPRHYATTDPSSLRSPVSVCVLSSGVTCSKGGNSNGKFYLRDGGFSCGEVTCRCCEISGPPHPTLQPQHSGESPRHHRPLESTQPGVRLCLVVGRDVQQRR